MNQRFPEGPLNPLPFQGIDERFPEFAIWGKMRPDLAFKILSESMGVGR